MDEQNKDEYSSLADRISRLEQQVEELSSRLEKSGESDKRNEDELTIVPEQEVAFREEPGES